MSNIVDEKFWQRAKDIVKQMTLEEKLGLLTTHHSEVKRLGLSDFHIGTEVARGFVGREKDEISTVFPQPVGLASTFDTDLMLQLGEIASNEARAYYNDDKKSCLCLWGPTIDPVRDPRWGRVEEAYGEDVFLAGELARAYTTGMAGDNGTYYKTIPTLKHFCANNNEQNRGSDDSCCTLRQKHEYYYAPFRNAVKNGGARSVMASYNKVNGVPSVCNTDLQNVLKDDWGLWFVVTDGGGFSQIYTSHHYTDSHSETLALSLKAGCDTMTDDETIVKNAALRALKENKITEQDIDKALENVIFARIKLGQLDNDCPFDSISKEIVDCEEYKNVDLRAALEQVCLLKNDGILPIKTAPKKIAVVGAMADENPMDWYTGISSGDKSVLQGIREEYPESVLSHDSLWDIVAIKAQNGKYLSVDENGNVAAIAEKVGESEMFELQKWGENWNCFFSVKYKKYLRLEGDGSIKLHDRQIYAWFTQETFNFFAVPESDKTVIEEFLFHRRLKCSDDGSISASPIKCERNDVLFTIETISTGESRAKVLAKENDLVFYCVGNHPLQVAKECYDRKTLALNIQPKMAVTLCEYNPSTVMTVVSSYPFAIVEENEKLPAILYTSHAGAHLGTAVARTLSGKNNPSAKLPLTWYASDNDLHDIKDYDIEKNEVTYMYFKGKPLYAFGHGLSYSSFEYGKLTLERQGGCVKASIDIKNTSERDGTEVVQIYYSVPTSQAKRPDKKLCGFARVFVRAGESTSAEIIIPDHALEIYDLRNGKMIVESGLYNFFAASASDDIRAQASLEIVGEPLGKRGATFEAQSFESSDKMRICYSKKLGRHYIKVVGWGGSATYGGVDLYGKSKIMLSAMASVNPCDLTADFGGEKATVRVTSTDSEEDFVKYTLDIPKNAENCDTITISTGDAAGLLDITIE